MTYSATKISTFRGNVGVSRGTGFFYVINLRNDSQIHLLVTNRHVLEGCDTIRVVFHLAAKDSKKIGPSGRFIEKTVDISRVGVVSHPSADLCAILIGSIIFEIDGESADRIAYATISSSDIPTVEEWADMDAILPVTMVGCPNGLFDSVNGLPIARSGSTASHVDKPFQGQQEFLIDLACFPGSSGSPVFLYSTGALWSRKNGGYNLGGIKLTILGILRAGPTIDSGGRIVLNQPPSVIVTTMMHLGIVIKATALLELEQLVLTALKVSRSGEALAKNLN